MGGKNGRVHDASTLRTRLVDMPSSPVLPTRSRRGFLGLAAKAGAIGAVVATGAIEGSAVAGAASTSTGSLGSTGAVVTSELGYAETVADASTGTSLVVPNLALRVTVGDGPVAVEYGGYVASSVANGLVKLYLLRDGAPIHEVGCTVAGAGGVGYLRGHSRIAATQIGPSTFTVLLANWTAKATVRVLAMPLSPAFVQARLL